MSLAAAPSGTAGPLALLLVLVMGLAVWLLIRNMSARLRRLPPTFEEPVHTETGDDEDAAPSPPAP